jgi:hypothetical protein
MTFETEPRYGFEDCLEAERATIERRIPLREVYDRVDISIGEETAGRPTT